MKNLKPCPYCKSHSLSDKYIYIECNDCKMTGPKMNGGQMNEHCDHIDNVNARKAWNELPR